ncbi:hypothetical protein ERO13_D11G218750v2 [Gossypium hirsutum]|nr:hypothetical protein ERO13_D11G218750v2 [Gossypium hirsutum]KAG4121616.1 hypothetical protein ERO13_D11G218750v2 [Gossypium hirsutum]
MILGCHNWKYRFLNFSFALTVILGCHNLNQSLPCCNGIDVVYKLYIMCFLFS